MAAELAPQDPASVTVIATGGLAPLVIHEVSVIDAYEPWLTLIGLRLTYERNTTPVRVSRDGAAPVGDTTHDGAADGTATADDTAATG